MKDVPRRTEPVGRRQFLKVAAAAVTPALTGFPAGAEAREREPTWVGTWATANVAQEPSVAKSLADQTLRQIVHVSIGGSATRLRLENTYGTGPLDISAAHVALLAEGAAIVPGSGRTLTFGGRPSIRIAPGATVLGDAVDLAIPPLSDVAIDLYVPDTAPTEGAPFAFHSSALQTSYVTAGNVVGAPDLPGAALSLSWHFLKSVEVLAAKRAGAIVILGDSITDGIQSTDDTNNRWPDHLARRLAARDATTMGVLNVAISGNQLLFSADPPSTSGVNAQARFDRDVLAQTGVTHVIVLEGINDCASGIPLADAIIAAHGQLIARAHAAGLTIYGATLTPAGATGIMEANRQAVNEWIRTSGAYDAIIDFDEVLRDPSDPTSFLPLYDSGDHVHPNDAGYAAMAQAIPLALFKKRKNSANDEID